ncbi:LOW QUALITY PROTEIN: nucleic acid dioxygenase ALKBH1-like [Acanthaster planci]|uniref:LOW QUALITY PROTEIN: nucleic acid dioxygenase ALKBH1-like n=1 Tax=Acanthaster planci TaxID=133434 RepID=A0A8B7Y5H7_ACAPL|nr:LOW QUALITY PROTEIN: nucleic acid dioxygenase ALKBH1-like [Acanthaster planci]
MAAPMEDSDGSRENKQENDEFRVQFKRYKRRKPPPDLSEVIDFQNSQWVSRFHPKVTCQDCATMSSRNLGLKPVGQWRCFMLEGAPGFVYIENPFHPGYQRYWIKRCLQDYPNKPSVCNLDNHHPNRGDTSLWDGDGSIQSKKKTLMDHLRWVTLGYHYDWTAKVYHWNQHTPFPCDLADLSAFVAAVMGFSTFQSQAAIVNYYHGDSTLGGHTDHSEFDLSAPIISYSFGQSAIFLLGGRTKEISPLAMYLHSGDIIIMGGQSRLAYHAVPRILMAEGSKKLPACLDQVETPDILGSSCKHMSGVKWSTPNSNGETLVSKVFSACSKDHKSDQRPAFSGHAGVVPRQCDQEITSKEGSVHKEIQASELHELSQGFGTENDTVSALRGSFKLGGLTCETHGPRWAGHMIHETTQALQDPQAWERFATFMSSTRINVSVRQVTGPGCDFPPDTVTSCQEPDTHTWSTCSDASGSKRKAEYLDQG